MTAAREWLLHGMQLGGVPALACGAWWLARRDEPVRRRTRLLRVLAAGGGGPPDPSGRTPTAVVLSAIGRLTGALTRRSGIARRWVGAPVDPALLALPLGLLLCWPTRSPVPALVAAVGAVPLRRAGRRRRAAGAAERLRGEIVVLASALAGELRSGATPAQAMRMVAAEQGRTELVAAAGYGGDVPRALRRLARSPGGEGAAGIAACWQVAAESGAGLAAGLERVAEGLRAESAVRESVRAELAGHRSTAVLLAGLPLFALALGSSLGAEPVRVLLHTPSGLCSAGVGAALEYAGLAWTSRIIRTAEGQPAGARAAEVSVERR